MKKKIANRSLVILVLIVLFGLFQAWKEEKNPFVFTKDTSLNSNQLPDKFIQHQLKENYILNLTSKK